MRVWVRYLLLQMPGWALASVALYLAWSWYALPPTYAIGGWLAWVAKDLVLYPFVRHAYAQVPSELIGVEQMVGRLAVADEALAPGGYVRLRGELWRAESAVAVEAGERVVIRRVHGLTLHVEPAPDSGGR
ncbi:MAG: NfeD family protein [Deltaproteobacteria bacterium]|nr:NfeD family protein [Deltaproteobacteria bacterium]MBW2413671.1 NfeD family protein [Deltaproteobacteria bacterium]